MSRNIDYSHDISVKKCAQKEPGNTEEDLIERFAEFMIERLFQDHNNDNKLYTDK
jgi:hypothetical protein